MGRSCLTQSSEFKESCSIHSDQYHLQIWGTTWNYLWQWASFQGRHREVAMTVQHHKSSPYRPKTNGAIEAANKNIGWILKKSTKNYKDWHLQLPYALWGYKISIRSSTGATPYSLVYGMEAILPIETSVHSLKTVLESEIPEADWLQSRYDQLCMLDEKRLNALYHIVGYQRRLRKAFDKKVRTRDLKLGDLMLKEIWTSIQDANEKFKQN